MLEWPRTGWNRVAEIEWIAVLSEYQMKGLGSGLMKEMERYAREEGIRKVYVEPSVENENAICFYIRNGYRPEAMRRDWYKDGEDSVILGKHLNRSR